MSSAERQNKAPPRSREQPPARPYLLRLLDGVEVYLNDVVLQPANEQRAAVRQQETVHVLGLVHAAGEGRGQPSRPCPARGGSGEGGGGSILTLSQIYLLRCRQRGRDHLPQHRGSSWGRHNPPAARGRHSQVVKNDEAPP